MKLEALCKFPFYCSPCVSDTTLNGPVTIKVTKNLFKKSQYKLFFSQPVKDAVNDQKELFIPTFDNNDPLVQEGFKFSYTIVAPSTSWEGLQGFIFLKKIDGGYRITGIDTVP